MRHCCRYGNHFLFEEQYTEQGGKDVRFLKIVFYIYMYMYKYIYILYMLYVIFLHTHTHMYNQYKTNRPSNDLL